MQQDEASRVAEPRDAAGPIGIWLRPLGSPVPLGFVGLGAASLVVAGFDLGWMPVVQQAHVGTILIAFAFPLQLVAAILAFLARDGATATALGTQAGTWLAIGLVYATAAAGSTTPPLGLLLLASGAALGFAAAATAKSKLVPALVIALTGLRFASAGIFELSGNERWQDISGVVALAVVAAAAYAVFALALEDAEDETVLPLGRVGRGAEALEGGRAEQVEPAVHEPGVRKML